MKPLLVSIGCLNVDVIANIAQLPQRDSRLMTDGFQKALGGMATNVACAAAALGEPLSMDVELIASMGDDADGRWVRAELAASNIGDAWLDQDDKRTGMCLILVEPDGSRVIISEPSRLNHHRVGERIQASEAGRRSRHLHVDGFHAAAVFEHLRNAHRLGWSTSVDIDELDDAWFAADRFTEMLGFLDVAFINRNCAGMLFPDSDAADWCERLSVLAGATDTVILLTLGAKGSVLMAAQQPSIEIPALAVDSVDTTGAGDVFAGIFLSAWLHGLAPPDAATYASIGAALSTIAHGAQGYLPEAQVIVRHQVSYAAAREKTHTDRW